MKDMNLLTKGRAAFRIDIEDINRKRKNLRTVQLIAAPVTAYYSVIAFFTGYTLWGYLAVTSTAIIILGILFSFVLKDKLFSYFYRVSVYAFFISYLILHMSISYFGKVEYFGLFFIAPLIGFYLLGRKEGFAVSLVYVVCIGIALFVLNTTLPAKNIFEDLRTNFLITLTLTLIASFIFERSRALVYEKQIENQKRLEESEKKLMVANVRIKEKAKEADNANQAKSEFLANMSHELRTPLNHIIGFTELLHDDKAGETRAVRKEYLGDILQSSRHLLGLINEVLDMSKIEAGKMELDVNPVDVNDLLQYSLRMAGEKAKSQGITIQLENVTPYSMIYIDKQKVQQILFNLISNALKFTPEGGDVSIRVDRQDAANLLFSVADTGIGIAKEDQFRVFLPFDQLNNALSRKHNGTGLGLSLTKRLVELLGGKIWLTSGGLNKGSTFFFTLPLDGRSAGNQ